MALVVIILTGEISVAAVRQSTAATVAEVEDWHEKFLLNAEDALRSRYFQDF
jgi:hypothetical protein